MTKHNQILLLAFIFVSMMQAQNFKEFQWKNRILVIETTSENNWVYQNQLLALKEKISALSERKLIIFEIINQQFKISTPINLAQNGIWHTLNENYKSECTEENEFSIALIGLDGSLKLQQHSLLLTEVLFKTIDVMPMRRNEITNR